MNKPKFFRGRPIIQIGEIYEVDGIAYKVITATSKILGGHADQLTMTGPVYWLDNIETGERVYMPAKVLESKFKEGE